MCLGLNLIIQGTFIYHNLERKVKMKGSNDYTKLFGSPKNSSYYGDVKVSKNTDIFGFDKDQKKKKKKKKKKSRIDNIVKTAVGYDETDELLNRFICFEKDLLMSQDHVLLSQNK